MTNIAKETALGRLRIDHVESPLALDNPRPVFSWQMLSKRTGFSGQNHMNSFNHYSLGAVVPTNTTATLYLPVPEEKAEAFAALPGASFIGMEERLGRACAKFELQSGSYSF